MMAQTIDVLNLPPPAGIVRPTALEALVIQRDSFERGLAADPSGPNAAALRRAIEWANTEIVRIVEEERARGIEVRRAIKETIETGG